MLLRPIPAGAVARRTLLAVRERTLRLADGRPNAYPEAIGTEFHIAERRSERVETCAMTRTIHG